MQGQTPPTATPDVKALLQQALMARTAGMLTQARALYDQALTKARELKDRKGEVDALYGMGLTFPDQLEKAMELFQQARLVYKAMGYHRQEASLVDFMADRYRKAEKYDEASALYQQAVELYKITKDEGNSGNSLINIGTYFILIGDAQLAINQTEKAIASFQQSLNAYKTAGIKSNEANALNALGRAYLKANEPEKAEESFRQAKLISQNRTPKRDVAQERIKLGSTYLKEKKPEKALESFQQALQHLQGVGTKEQEAFALHSIGLEYMDSDWPLNAVEFFRKALSLYRALEDREGQGNSLNNTGTVYFLLFQLEKALGFYQQSLPLFNAVGNKLHEAHANYGIGTIYLNTNQPEKAVGFFQRALPLYREVGNRAVEANTLNCIGVAYYDSGRPAKALELFEQTLMLRRAIGKQEDEATDLSNIGNAALASQQPQKALEFYQQALRLARSVGNRQAEANALGGIGRVYQKANQPEKALLQYQEALRIDQADGRKRDLANTLKSLADTEQQLNRPAEAEAHYEQAVVLLERLRDDLGRLSEAKSSFLQNHLGTYYKYLHLLLERGNAIKAFEVAQKTKARTLLDLMATGRVDVSRELTDQEREQERALRDKADRLNAQMVKEGVQNEVGAKKRYEALKVQLTQTESQLQTLTDALYALHPSLAQKRAAKSATVAELTALLPTDTALLDYIVLSQSTIALFVVTKSAVKALMVPVAYPKLAQQAAAFRNACADPRQDYRTAAMALYRTLLAPAETQLVGIKRLVVCPDGALWDVPFQALLSGGQFLAQRYELAYAYSATGVQAALTNKPGRKKPTGTLLALVNPDFGSSERFGDLDAVPGQRPIKSPDRPIKSPDRPITSPDRPIDSPSRAFDSVSRAGKIVALPGTQREGEALGKLFPTATLLSGRRAQESAAKQTMSQYRFLHFATHGFFNDASPLLSSLVMAQPTPGYPLGASQAREQSEDGFLTAREIFELDLSAELVVLSACNTARGVQRTGDGVIGLTWALFVAGCPTQVVSQWAVNDASTATLMTRFYGNLATRKLGKGAALRQASLSLMSSTKHQHPYYWAPFVLMGDWR